LAQNFSEFWNWNFAGFRIFFIGVSLVPRLRRRAYLLVEAGAGTVSGGGRAGRAPVEPVEPRPNLDAPVEPVDAVEAAASTLACRTPLAGSAGIHVANMACTLILGATPP